jgi:hypothetical protein
MTVVDFIDRHPLFALLFVAIVWWPFLIAVASFAAWKGK